MDIKFVAIEDIELVIDAYSEEKLFIKNEKTSLPDVVIPRVDSSYQMTSIMDFMEHA
jgi:hypothetical protein